MKLEHDEPWERTTTKNASKSWTAFNNGVLSKIAGKKIEPQALCFPRPMKWVLMP